MADRQNRPSHCGWASEDSVVHASRNHDNTGEPFIGTPRQMMAARNKRRIEEDRARDVTGK